MRVFTLLLYLLLGVLPTDGDVSPSGTVRERRAVDEHVRYAGPVTPWRAGRRAGRSGGAQADRRAHSSELAKLESRWKSPSRLAYCLEFNLPIEIEPCLPDLACARSTATGSSVNNNGCATSSEPAQASIQSAPPRGCLQAPHREASRPAT